MLRIHTLVVGPLAENCYLAWAERETPPASALVVDPGAEPERIAAALRERHLAPAAFLLTHCHGDHLGALGDLKAAWPAAPVVVHAAEAEWLSSPARNLSLFLGASVTAPRANQLLQGGEKLRYAGVESEVLHVPGHSPGSVAYLVRAPGESVASLFCGDILFQGGIGRTDFPGSAGEEALVANIRTTLFPLPLDTRVYPGHGPSTTIGQERAFNPFCGEGTDYA